MLALKTTKKKNRVNFSISWQRDKDSQSEWTKKATLDRLECTVNPEWFHASIFDCDDYDSETKFKFQLVDRGSILMTVEVMLETLLKQPGGRLVLIKYISYMQNNIKQYKTE